MKKSALFLSTLVFLFTTDIANAQVINPGFEVWSNDMLVPSAMNPNTGNNTYGWWDYNSFNHSLLGSSPISVVRCTDTVRTGNYSVRLETQVYTPTSWGIYKFWGIPFIGHEYNDTLGILFNGKVDVSTQSYKPGIPFSQKLSQFKFYYQYNPNGNDIAECRVSLMSGGTYVAGGVFSTGVATGSSGWQQAVINFSYVSGLTPDTMYVLMSSSSLDGDPHAGSVLWIDDVSTVLLTGVEQILEEDKSMTIFPNPVKNKLHITTDLEFTKIYLMDIEGKKVKQFEENEKVLDVSSISQGVYFIRAETTMETFTQKVIIE
jgi:hypothetical protein